MGFIFPSSRELGMVASALEAMASGNFNVSIPTLSGTLAPLTRSLKELQESYVTTFLSLDAQREQLTAIINALPNGLLFIAQGRVSLINTAARSMLGLKATDEGKRFEELELPRAIVNAVEMFLNSGESTLTTRTEPNALMQTFQLALSRLDANAPAQEAHFVLSLTDISARVKTDAMRKDFVAAASHELKTPVAGIALMSETATMALDDGDSEAAREMLQHIAAETRNLQALVLDLLDLSRFEERGELDARSDLVRALKTTEATRRSRAEHKGLVLDVNYNGLGLQEVFVELHEADLIIILDNLVDNAIAYTDEGSVRIEASVESERKRAVVSVSDTGIGIDEKDFERIFERFYRVDTSRSRMSGGTGLGLSLVKHAVEQAGGAVTLTSRAGVGSTFTVELPLV